MRVIGATEFRQNLASVLDRVIDDAEDAVVTRDGSEAVVIMSKSEYDSIMETEYLLSNPANAKWLMESIAQADAGKAERHDLDDDDRTADVAA